MSKHRYTDKVCAIIIVIAILLTSFVVYAKEENIITITKNDLAYTSKIFDDSKVHSINIVVNENDWNGMLENASSEEYINCNLVIDGESIKNIAIRPKGNSSLSSVSSSDSDRYSLKIEFDHYDNTNLYYGLDKMALNNIIQDPTYMKDYLCYKLMNEMGVASPLCSYTRVFVNGENFGFYIAVEGVEEAFAERNYGNDYGNIYKPDTAEIGGGKDGEGGGMPDMDKMKDAFENGEMPEGLDGMFEDGEMPEGLDGMFEDGEMPEGLDGMFEDGEMPEGIDGMFGDGEMPEQGQIPQNGVSGDAMSADKKGGGFTMGSSSEVSLKYTDDDIDSYSTIFESSVFDITKSDKKTLIASLKQLNEDKDLEEVVDVEQVIKYFVVHNFVENYDSYTGSIMHNYYLYEKDGVLSMIPWDYNLAFGSFSMGGGKSTSSDVDSATSLVNYPIDTPISTSTIEDRPMLSWIFSNEEYLELYHQYFDEFIAKYFENGYCENLINTTKELIAPYVKEDPTAFCTYEEFESGVEALQEFCSCRAKSVRGQLDGTIPSISEEQSDTSNFVDGKSVDIDSLGSAGMGGKMDNNKMNNFMNRGNNDTQQNTAQDNKNNEKTTNTADDKQAADKSNQATDKQKQQQGQINKNTVFDEKKGMGMDFEKNMPDKTSAINSDNVIMIIICVLALAIAIFFAKNFKRKKY